MNATPRPLTEDQKRTLGLAGPIRQDKLDALASKFTKPDRVREVAPVKARPSNGW